MTEPTLNYVTCAGDSKALQGKSASPTHDMAYWEWNATGDPKHPYVVVCVHGLTRQGRDFDVLARSLSRYARVICPDVAGRGRSDWLADPMAYAVPQYAADMLTLLAHLHQRAPLEKLDWVGTSMGGLIGMAIAGQPGLPLPVPVRKLVLNDVGPTLEWRALQRIGGYVGQPIRFKTPEEAAQTLRMISAGFGPHTSEEWLALTLPMLRPMDDGLLGLHYDPDIGVALRAMTPSDLEQGEALVWQLYNQIQAQTLLIRGADSDLLSAETAQRMTQVGPKAHCVTLENIGHAPTLVAAEQVQIVQDFLMGRQ